MASFIDFHCKDVLRNLDHIVKDSWHCLDKIRTRPGGINQGFFMVTIDIVSLFTAIPHTQGLEMFEASLLKFGTFSSDKCRFIKELMELVLENNFMFLNGKYFRQKTGVAMGARCAPIYANMVLPFWETQTIFSSCFWDDVALYLRFLDDILIFWKGTKERFTEFESFLNTTTTFLSFTSKMVDNHCEYLDILLYKNNDTLDTNIHRKKTHSNSYLHFDSCQPYHQRKNLVKGQMVRLSRIISEDVVFLDEMKILSSMFSDRGYPSELINNISNEIRIKRNHVYQPIIKFGLPNTSSTNRPPFGNDILVIPYNDTSMKIENAVRDCWSSVFMNQGEYTDILGFLPKITYSRGMNLKEYFESTQRKFWIILMVLLRITVITLAGYPVFQDEQERFICNTMQPGCSNVCYDAFCPVSPLRFWITEIVTLCLPYAGFCAYVIHKVTRQTMSENIQVCVYNKNKAYPVRRTQQVPHRGAMGCRTVYEAETEKMHDFSGAYLIHLFLRMVAEAGFGAGQYYLFGFLVPQKFACSQPSCPSIDCYSTRPTEKTIMMNFMFGVNAISFLLSVFDLIYVIKRAIRHNHKNKLSMEKIYHGQEYYLSYPGKQSDFEMIQDCSPPVNKRARRQASEIGDSVIYHEVENSSVHSEVLSQYSANSVRNCNNTCAQRSIENEQQLPDQNGDKPATCTGDHKLTQATVGKYWKKCPTKECITECKTMDVKPSADIHSRLVRHYSLVEVTPSEA
ncbi:gap junction delta-4 protein [Protopterus annectens]|uniref:gap junction delta-4 protein n=1 Tax=Protopterus annectens TaxID=7888 RepID=UPI001CF9E3C3|nr:gap junction delta-4 protein [Protopterus annectens]